jgi:hypothetical protein
VQPFVVTLAAALAVGFGTQALGLPLVAVLLLAAVAGLAADALARRRMQR